MTDCQDAPSAVPCVEHAGVNSLTQASTGPILIRTSTITSTANTALGAFRQAWEAQGAVSGRLARAAGWSLAGALFARTLSLAATVGASRTLGSELFGRFAFVQNTVSVFALVLGSAIAITATKRVADYAKTNPAQANYQAYHNVLVGGLIGTVSAIGLFATSGLLATTVLGDPSLAPALRLSTPLVAFSTVSTVVTGVLAGFERFRLLTMLMAVRGMFLFPLLTVGAQMGSLSGALVGVTVAEAATAVASCVCLRRVCIGGGSVPSARRDADIRGVWRLTVPAIVGTIVTQISVWGTTAVLVTQRDGYAALGLFIAADRWRQLLLFVPSCTATVVLPLLTSLHATRDAGGYRTVFNLTIAANLLMVTAGALALLPLARAEMRFFGPEYEIGSNVLRLLVIGTIPVVLNTALGHVLVSLDRMWWRCAADVVLSTLLMLLAWLLVPRFQAAGLATAHLISFGVVAMVLFVAARIRLSQVRSAPEPKCAIL
jgi:O-antigen/teichoic acid export membrane protein